MQTLSCYNVYLTRNLGKKQCGARIGLMVTGFPLQLFVNMWWMSLRKFPSICRTGLDFDSSRGMNSHSFNTVLSDEVRIMMARLIAERVCLQKNTWWKNIKTHAFWPSCRDKGHEGKIVDYILNCFLQVSFYIFCLATHFMFYATKTYHSVKLNLRILFKLM